jgi:serine/threonine protein kinase
VWTSATPTASCTPPANDSLSELPPASTERDALPPGTRLDEFEILRVVGVGGFGIVYLAMDHALQRQVAIKEYMPAALAARKHEALDVQIRSASHAKTYAIGLRSFVNEARLLAGFDHPSLVKVYRFWEAHGTAYMAMQYYQGRTLNSERRAMHGAPCEAWLRGLTDPLLDALELLHSEGVFHRDISPDNIIVLPGGQPVLLDFGAARRVIGDHTQSLTAILKPNFAPVEQYADVPGMRQGAWTDLYALGAVVYFMLKGEAPAPAVMRAVRDDMPPLASQAGASLSGVSESYLGAIDWALTIAPQDRPQDVAALREALNGKVVPRRPARAVIETTRSTRARTYERLAPTTARALRGRYAPTRLVAPLQLTQTAAQRAHTIDAATSAAPISARRVVLTIVMLLCIAVAFAAWKLSESVVAPTPIAVPAIESRPMTSQGGARQRSTPSAARPTAVPTTAPTAVPTALPAASDPQLACADRNFLSKAVCVGRQCLLPQFARHPVCVDLQRAEEARHQSQRYR